jgi:hypothetical protein
MDQKERKVPHFTRCDKAAPGLGTTNKFLLFNSPSLTLLRISRRPSSQVSPTLYRHADADADAEFF